MVAVSDDTRVYMFAALIDDRDMDAVQISVDGQNLGVCVNINVNWVAWVWCLCIVDMG